MEQNQSSYAEYATPQNKTIYASSSLANAEAVISFRGLITNFHLANVVPKLRCACQRQQQAEAVGFYVVPRQIRRVEIMGADILNGQSLSSWLL